LIHIQNIGELWLIDFGSSNGLFVPAEDFDMDGFLAPSQPRRTLTDDDIRAVLAGKAMTRSDAVNELMKHTGLGKSACYAALDPRGKFRDIFEEDDGRFPNQRATKFLPRFPLGELAEWKNFRQIHCRIPAEFHRNLPENSLSLSRYGSVRVSSHVIDMLDSIRLKGAAFAIEHGFFEWAEQMLAELSAEASAGSQAAALRQRILDIQTAFWQARCRLASIVIARFPNYLAGRLYADLCRSHNRRGVSR
jgi:hypothetical protein